MKTREPFLALVVALLLVGPAGARPQSTGTPVEVEVDEGLAALRGRIFAFVEALVEYTEDARVSEAALGDILEHYGSLEEIRDEGEDERVIDRAFRDGRYDFDVVVKDPAYAEWCRERGLEPEAFLRGLLRLEAVRMRQEGLEGLERALAELPEKEAELERIREEVGDDAYREGKASLTAAAAMVEETRVLMAKLPEPTASERALLERHAARIEAVLGEDGPE